MVDSLLNRDIVSICCGPKHVVALSENGRVFVWGKLSHGRLGVVRKNGCNQRQQFMEQTRSHKHNDEPANKCLPLPQEVIFPSSEDSQPSSSTTTSPQIKRVFCGDRCTVFIDSLNKCWACGQNRSNRLGLDTKRRFKRTLLINESWTPSEVLALSKYRVVSCSIGRTHSCFLTDDRRLIVLGQDWDSSFQFRQSLSSPGRELPERTGRVSRNSEGGRLKRRLSAGGRLISRSASKSLAILTKSMLHHGQLEKFKLQSARKGLAGSGELSSTYQTYTKIKTNRMLRHQVDSYLSKSRSIKRMPFDQVLDAACSSQFSLALTQDNRVYFWGTRSYDREDSERAHWLAPIGNSKLHRPRVEPQLVANCSDECFIKIGQTNSQLMSSIQTLGSDHPIIHAQDPRLMANSLADLWILDYRPASRLSRSSSSSLASLPLPHSTGLESASNSSAGSSSCCSCCCEAQQAGGESQAASAEDDYADDDLQTIDQQRHDAILEPQPIVSLYVPAAYSLCGTLQATNLFCFDDDRFFLVLDTTIQLSSTQQHQSQKQQYPIPMQSNSAGASSPGSISRQTANSPKAGWRLGRTPAATGDPLDQRSALKLQMVVEAQTDAASACSSKSAEARHQVARETLAQSEAQEALMSARSMASDVPECCRPVEENEEDLEFNDLIPGTEDASNQADNEPSQVSSTESTIASLNRTNPNNTLNSSSPGGGMSLDEPRSLSTFAGGAIGQHMMIVNSRAGNGGPRMVTLGELDNDMDKLAFESGSPTPLSDAAQSQQLHSKHLNTSRFITKHLNVHLRRQTQRRRPRTITNQSDSTTMTGDLDETSSMPSWVRNEFTLQQQQQQPQEQQQRFRPQEQQEQQSEVVVVDMAKDGEREEEEEDDEDCSLTCVTLESTVWGVAMQEGNSLDGSNTIEQSSSPLSSASGTNSSCASKSPARKQESPANSNESLANRTERMGEEKCVYQDENRTRHCFSHPNLAQQDEHVSQAQAQRIPELLDKEARSSLLDCEVYETLERLELGPEQSVASIGSLCAASSLENLINHSESPGQQLKTGANLQGQISAPAIATSSAVVSTPSRQRLSQDDTKTQNQEPSNVVSAGDLCDSSVAIQNPVTTFSGLIVKSTDGLGKQSSSASPNGTCIASRRLSISVSSLERHKKRVSLVETRRRKLESDSCSSLGGSLRRSLLKLFC